MKIAEFFAALGFDVDDTGLIAFEKGLKNLRNEFAFVTAAAAAALYAMDKFVSSSIAGASALRDFNMQTGLSTDKLQKWQIVGQLADFQLTADAVTASIQNLQSHIVAIQLGAGNARPFSMFGIDASHADAFQVLDQLRDKISRYPRDKAVSLIQEMGLNPGFINILTLSKDKFDALFASMSRSQAAQQQLIKLGSAIVLLKLEFSLWKDNFVASIVPTLLKGIDLMTKFGVAVQHAWEVFNMGINSVPKVTEALKLMLPVIALITAAFFPLTATMLGIILLFDDIYTYLHGGDSVTGDVIGSLQKVWANIGPPIKEFWEKIKTFVQNAIIDPLEAVINNVKFLKDAADSINKLYDRVTAKDALDPKGQAADIISRWPVSPLKWAQGSHASDPVNQIHRENGAAPPEPPAPAPASGAYPPQPTGLTNAPVAPAAGAHAPSGPPADDDGSFDPVDAGQGKAAGPALTPQPNPAAAQSVVFHNQFIIDGSADSHASAELIAGHLQTQLSHSLSDFNNGPVK